MIAQYPFAFVTYLIRNDSYLPGALVLAHMLRRQSSADVLCFVGDGVSDAACALARTVFSAVIRVPDIVVPSDDAKRRPYLPFVFTKLHALRLGPDGDLGRGYRRVVVLDADILPMRCYDHLFAVNPPAGILNERRDTMKESTEFAAGGHAVAALTARWTWHEEYRLYPHGQRIPADVTDRVRRDARNYGVNTALLVVEPNMGEYRAIVTQLTEDDETVGWCRRHPWPDMQYLTMRWSGRWHNVDVCFAGLGGYPSIEVLFGTHFGGPKPWQIRNRSVAARFSRFADFRLWYRCFLDTLAAYPALASNGRMSRIASYAEGAVASARVPRGAASVGSNSR